MLHVATWIHDNDNDAQQQRRRLKGAIDENLLGYEYIYDIGNQLLRMRAAAEQSSLTLHVLSDRLD
jgi:hypothetical protein